MRLFTPEIVSSGLNLSKSNFKLSLNKLTYSFTISKLL